MEAKHSSGPWRFNRFESSYYREIFDANGVRVCLLPDLREDNDANARLIAAAPEMLRALNEMMELVSVDERDFPPHEYEAFRIDIIDRACAAIAKARIETESQAAAA